MTTEQLLEQLRGILLPHIPATKMTPSLQVPATQISTRDFPHEQSKSSAMRTNDKPPAERVQRLSLGDPVITDKGVADRTFQNPQFFNQDEMPSIKAVSIRVRCRLWLKARLSDGPVPLSEVKQEAQQLGYTPKALRVTRKQLGVKPTACLALPADQHS